MSFSTWLSSVSTWWGNGTSRNPGLQTADPSSYLETPAAAVTVDTAMQLSAVWGCIKLISESIAYLPLSVMRIEGDHEVLETRHPVARLLMFRPNRWQTIEDFIETMAFQLAISGNCVAVKGKNSRGEIISLTPLMSGQIEIELQNDGEILYTYTTGIERKVYKSADVVHVKLFGNGIVGLSPLAYARNCIGIGIASENAVTKIYQNDGKRSGAIELPAGVKTTADQKTEIRTAYSALSSGDSRLVILDQGAKFNPISLSPQDIELLSARRFQIRDIARFFGVPSVLINDTESGTTWGSGIQQIMEGFYKFGIRPYLRRFESTFLVSLFTPDEWKQYNLKFDFNALLMPDIANRIKMYKEGVQGGIIAPNEARAMEGWKPKDGGDSLLVQRQMISLENVNQLSGVITDGTQQSTEA